METALHADFALIRAYGADTSGNLIYRGTARNLPPPPPSFASAAAITIAEVDEIVEPGQLDPEAIVAPQASLSTVLFCVKNRSTVLRRWNSCRPKAGQSKRQRRLPGRQAA